MQNDTTIVETSQLIQSFPNSYNVYKNDDGIYFCYDSSVLAYFIIHNNTVEKFFIEKICETEKCFFYSYMLKNIFEKLFIECEDNVEGFIRYLKMFSKYDIESFENCVFIKK